MRISHTTSTIRAHHHTCTCCRAMKWLFSVKRPASLRCRPKAVTAARADAVRVRIFASEGTDFGRWEPRAATKVDALFCERSKGASGSTGPGGVLEQDTLVFASAPGLERVWTDDGCPEDAKPAERSKCDPSPLRLRLIAPGGAIAPVRTGK